MYLTGNKKSLIITGEQLIARNTPCKVNWLKLPGMLKYDQAQILTSAQTMPCLTLLHVLNRMTTFC